MNEEDVDMDYVKALLQQDMERIESDIVDQLSHKDSLESNLRKVDSRLTKLYDRKVELKEYIRTM